MQFIFRSTGAYFGFIDNGNLFSRDGEYLGWVEGDPVKHIWDTGGRYRGQLWQGEKYIITNRFAVAPVPRPAKPKPAAPPLPPPPPNVLPVPLPTGWIDAF